MTLKNFLAFCEGFYGEKYSGVFLDVMAAYLEDKSEAFLDAAARVLVMRFSRIYGKTPGPAEIEKNIDEIRQGIPEPECVPEHYEEISDRDREEMCKGLAAFRERISKGKCEGPLAGLLFGTLGTTFPTAAGGGTSQTATTPLGAKVTENVENTTVSNASNGQADVPKESELEIW
jgi:hypothetical protein